MKKFFPIVILVFFGACGKKSGTNLIVDGSIQNGAVNMIYLEQNNPDGTAPVIIDSAKVEKGKFRLNTSIREESLLSLRADKQMYPFAQFINDRNKISVDIDFSKTEEVYSVNGSPSSEILLNFRRKINEEGMKMAAAVNAFQQLSGSKPNDSLSAKDIDSLKKKHIASYQASADALKQYTIDVIDKSESAPLSLYVLGGVQQYFEQFGGKPFTRAEIADVIAKLTSKFPTDPVVMKLKKNAGPVMATDFSLPDTSGHPLPLSSLKGKYVLVDFWASWCKPCREENPNVVAAWKTYNNKNFTILGVSLDQDKGQWLNAIHSDSLTWNHVSDLKYWNNEAAALYHVRSIPYNFLVDPEGKIIAEDIRGQDLFSTLNKYVK